MPIRHLPPPRNPIPAVFLLQASHQLRACLPAGRPLFPPEEAERVVASAGATSHPSHKSLQQIGPPPSHLAPDLLRIEVIALIASCRQASSAGGSFGSPLRRPPSLTSK